MALSASIQVRVAASHTGALDNGSLEANHLLEKLFTLANGPAADQADLVFSDTRTLNASANEELDLAGVLTDAFGAAITFAKVKAILVIADAANTNDVIIGGAASNAFIGFFGDATDTVKARPGGFAALACPGAGVTVTAGTGDKLKLANSGGSTAVTFKILIIGTSV